MSLPKAGVPTGRHAGMITNWSAEGANRIRRSLIETFESGSQTAAILPSVDKEGPVIEQWIASDGCVVTIRPIRAADLDLEEAFVNSLSAATGRQRLMSSRRPSLEELKRFTEIDHRCERALIAVTMVENSERQIGVARFVLDSQSGDDEFAIVLSDDWQGRGLGAALLGRLITAARDFGAGRLIGVTHSINAGMIALGQKFGFSMAADPRDATVTNMTLVLLPIQL